MASNIRIKIGLKCSECGDINYTTTKNSKKTTDKIELKKYCPRLPSAFRAGSALRKSL